MNTLNVDSYHSDLPLDSIKLMKKGHLTPSFLALFSRLFIPQTTDARKVSFRNSNLHYQLSR